MTRYSAILLLPSIILILYPTAYGHEQAGGLAKRIDTIEEETSTLREGIQTPGTGEETLGGVMATLRNIEDSIVELKEQFFSELGRHNGDRTL